MPIKVISFDLDGTLVDDSFDQAIWFHEIPARYADKHGLAFHEAKARVLAEYAALKGHPQWTDMAFWFERFGIGDWREAAAALIPSIRLYPETLAVLHALRSRFRLIIITQAEPKFYTIKLGVGDLGSHFDRVYSTPQRFHKLAKDVHVYHEILDEMGIRAAEMLHVGDNPVHDYEVPRRLGIHALLLDRQGELSGPNVIHNLCEMLDRPELVPAGRNQKRQLDV